MKIFDSFSNHYRCVRSTVNDVIVFPGEIRTIRFQKKYNGEKKHTHKKPVNFYTTLYFLFVFVTLDC